MFDPGKFYGMLRNAGVSGPTRDKQTTGSQRRTPSIALLAGLFAFAPTYSQEQVDVLCG